MDKKRKGYILLEMILSIFVISIIILGLYQIITVSTTANTKISAKIELNEQLQEIDFQIRNLLKESNDIISITTVDGSSLDNIPTGVEYNISSIKLKLKTDQETSRVETKNKEIKFKKDTKKLFINTLTTNDYSEGGYEIGDYVESISIKINSENNILVLLKLKKNDTIIEHKISMILNNIT